MEQLSKPVPVLNAKGALLVLGVWKQVYRYMGDRGGLGEHQAAGEMVRCWRPCVGCVGQVWGRKGSQCMFLDKAAGFKVIMRVLVSVAPCPISGSAAHPCRLLGK